MKVVILAGGYGTRLSELTRDIPKPMVEIGGYPILWHIMQIYAAHGFNEFVVALGYKGNLIKKFFIDYYANNSDLVVNLKDGSIEVKSVQGLDWKITLVDTGEGTLTGGRVKRLKPYLDETFMLTYGDGVSDVDLTELLKFHKKNQTLVTMTTIHPTSKYGKLEINESNKVEYFVEKPEFGGDWINGGFMVMEPEFLDWIDNDQTILEQQPLLKATETGNLSAFKHTGFWYCMDALRDRNELEELWQSGQAPWKIWDNL